LFCRSAIANERVHSGVRTGLALLVVGALVREACGVVARGAQVCHGRRLLQELGQHRVLAHGLDLASDAG